MWILYTQLEKYRVSIVDPVLSDFGWQFNRDNKGLSGSTQDHLYGYRYLHQLYTRA